MKGSYYISMCLRNMETVVVHQEPSLTPQLTLETSKRCYLYTLVMHTNPKSSNTTDEVGERDLKKIAFTRLLYPQFMRIRSKDEFDRTAISLEHG